MYVYLKLPSKLFSLEIAAIDMKSVINRDVINFQFIVALKSDDFFYKKVTEPENIISFCFVSYQQLHISFLFVYTGYAS